MNAYRVTDSVGTQFVVMAYSVYTAINTAREIVTEYGDNRTIASTQMI